MGSPRSSSANGVSIKPWVSGTARASPRAPGHGNPSGLQGEKTGRILLSNRRIAFQYHSDQHMTNPESIIWKGQSGAEYTYWLYPRGTNFEGDLAGNFILAKQISPGRFNPIFIGEGANLNTAITNNSKKSCIDLNGATHLFVHLSSFDALERTAETNDLLLRWKPVCNLNR